MSSISAIIYLLTNKITKKRYVGFTTNLPQRMHGHQARAKAGSHDFILSNSIRKHGWDAFECTVLAEHPDAEYAKTVLEPRFIKELNTYYENGQGYNMTWGGEGTLGYKRTPEQRQRMSERMKANPIEYTEEMCQAISERTKGENNPNYGKKATPEKLAKMSAGVLKAYAEGRLKPVVRTPEQIERFRQMSKTQVYTPERRQQMSEARRGKPGRPHTEEHKQHMSEIMTGRQFSEETLAKMALAQCEHLWTIRSIADGTIYETWSVLAFGRHFRVKPEALNKMLYRKANGIKVRKSRCLWEPISKIPMTDEIRQTIGPGMPWRVVSQPVA